jgi:hypothetical protein
LVQQNESTWQIDVTHGSQPEVSAAPVTHLSWTQLPPHDMPQMLPTSPTQIESHESVQQNESTAQIDVTHGSQPETRATPVEHSGWLHVPPGHWIPQTLGTAPTQRSSHASVQQNESWLQIDVTQGLHPDVSAAPCTQTSCAHVGGQQSALQDWQVSVGLQMPSPQTAPPVVEEVVPVVEEVVPVVEEVVDPPAEVPEVKPPTPTPLVPPSPPPPPAPASPPALPSPKSSVARAHPRPRPENADTPMAATTTMPSPTSGFISTSLTYGKVRLPKSCVQGRRRQSACPIRVPALAQ